MYWQFARIFVHFMIPRPSLLGIISELVLWTLILLVLYFGGVYIFPLINPVNQDHRQTITLAFDNAGQLAIGSPVNFMGTDIGYVSQLKIKGDKVEVQFKTYPDAIKIPKGTHFTVEFNGLAGAKTLEAIPPRYSERHYRSYIVEEPIRLLDVLKTQMMVAQALEYSSKTLSQGLSKVKDENTLLLDMTQINGELESTNQTMVKTLNLVQTKSRQVHHRVLHIVRTIQDFSQGVQDVQALTTPTAFRIHILSMFQDFDSGIMHVNETLNGKGFHRLQKDLARANYSTLHSNQVLHASLPRFMNGLTQFGSVLFRVNTSLTHWESALESPPLKQRFEHFKKTFHQVMQEIQVFLCRANAKLSDQ